MTTSNPTEDNGNKALVLAGIKGVFIDRDPTVLDRLFSDDYRQHNPQIPNGTAAIKAVLGSLSADFKYQLSLVVADGDYVMVHGHYVGWGPKPMVGVDIFRVANGKIAEHWDVLQEECPGCAKRQRKQHVHRPCGVSKAAIAAVVLCVDEKSQIQAVDRSQPMPPMPVRSAVCGASHDDKRHGTTSLFAALDIGTGRVIGKCWRAPSRAVAPGSTAGASAGRVGIKRPECLFVCRPRAMRRGLRERAGSPLIVAPALPTNNNAGALLAGRRPRPFWKQ